MGHHHHSLDMLKDCSGMNLELMSIPSSVMGQPLLHPQEQQLQQQQQQHPNATVVIDCDMSLLQQQQQHQQMMPQTSQLIPIQIQPPQPKISPVCEQQQQQQQIELIAGLAAHIDPANCLTSLVEEPDEDLDLDCPLNDMLQLNN